MTTTPPVTGGSNYPAGYVPTEGSKGAQGAGAAKRYDDATPIDDSAVRLQLPQASHGGVPQLAEPNISLDDILENLQTLLPIFLGKGDDIAQAAYMDLIKSNAKATEALGKARLEKIKEAITAEAKVETKGFWGKLFDIVVKAVVAIAAVVATVASGGALGPILLPLTIMSALSAVLDLVDTVLKDVFDVPGGIGLSPPSLAGLLKKCGVPEDIAGYIELGVAVLTLGASLGSLSTKFAAKILKMKPQKMTEFKLFSSKLSSGAQGVDSANNIRTGVTNINNAGHVRDAEKARAANKELQAWVIKSQQTAQAYMDALRDIMERLSSGTEGLTTLINQQSQTRMKVQANMV